MFTRVGSTEANAICIKYRTADDGDFFKKFDTSSKAPMLTETTLGQRQWPLWTPADDGQADPVLQSPSNALLDVSDLCRPNNRGGAVEASLPVFNRLVPLHQWHLRRQLRQRGRMLGKGRHDVGRAEQEMVWVGFLAAAQGAAHLTPIDSDSLVLTTPNCNLLKRVVEFE